MTGNETTNLPDSFDPSDAIDKEYVIREGKSNTMKANQETLKQEMDVINDDTN